MVSVAVLVSKAAFEFGDGDGNAGNGLERICLGRSPERVSTANSILSAS